MLARGEKFFGGEVYRVCGLTRYYPYYLYYTKLSENHRIVHEFGHKDFVRIIRFAGKKDIKVLRLIEAVL